MTEATIADVPLAERSAFAERIVDMHLQLGRDASRRWAVATPKLLGGFRWLLEPNQRAEVSKIILDIHASALQMLTEGRSNGFVRMAVAFRSTRAVVGAVSWKRVGAATLGVGTIATGVMKLIRWLESSMST